MHKYIHIDTYEIYIYTHTHINIQKNMHKYTYQYMSVYTVPAYASRLWWWGWISKRKQQPPIGKSLRSSSFMPPMVVRVEISMVQFAGVCAENFALSSSMYVCMYVCMYVYIYMCVCVCVCVCVHIYLYNTLNHIYNI
jgi:hypothetical protein